LSSSLGRTADAGCPTLARPMRKGGIPEECASWEVVFVCGADALVRLSTAAELRVSKNHKIESSVESHLSKTAKGGAPAGFLGF
jgi:hypothetical protein